jgi:hypothetical protein
VLNQKGKIGDKIPSGVDKASQGKVECCCFVKWNENPISIISVAVEGFYQ